MQALNIIVIAVSDLQVRLNKKLNTFNYLGFTGVVLCVNSINLSYKYNLGTVNEMNSLLDFMKNKQSSTTLVLA